MAFALTGTLKGRSSLPKGGWGTHDSMSTSHWLDAKKVCVLGAGTMGSGIAAHLANLGFDVSLFDLTPQTVSSQFDTAKSARPPHFYVPETAGKVKLLSMEKDFDLIAEADWVCEAIVEKMDIKKALFERLDPVVKPDAMLTTNTSGLQIGLLAEGRSESFRKRFMGTHFFNPPRYLKLLELIPTPDTESEAVKVMCRFLEDRVARRVVVAKDTPGFISNRYGMWNMIHTVHVAERLQLSIEKVDAITGPFLGRPRSASFRLNDLVGLDIMRDIAQNLLERCPHDPGREQLGMPPSMEFLLEKGWIGSKAGQGYYRKEGKELLAFDLQTRAYRQLLDASLPSLKELERLPFGERVSKALKLGDEVGDFLREYLVPALQYADKLKEEISHSCLDFDRVMQWGFGWDIGPFQMMDAIGHEAIGVDPKPYFDAGKQREFGGAYISLPSEPQYRTVKDFPVISKHETFNVRDLGDGVQCVSTTTKQGVITPQLVGELLALLETDSLKRFVLTSESKNYSVGFDLAFFDKRIEEQDWEGIDTALASLQKLTRRLGEVPSVAAVFGFGLGGGFELALGCCAIVADAEAKMGFPEAKVGLIPGGAGTCRMRAGAQTGGAKEIADAAGTLSLGTVADNADHARKLGLLCASDATCYLADRLLMEAKEAALTVQPKVDPAWRDGMGPLSGMIDAKLDELQSKGLLTDHDVLIGDKVKQVFSKSASFEEALSVERKVFIELCKSGLTHARIKHMLETNKPLRN